MTELITRRRALDDAQGASLIEVVLAAAILATGVLSMVQLFSLATVSNASARSITMAVTLAAQKSEELRAVNRTLASTLGPTLTQNVVGAVDHLEATGAVVGVGTQVPPRAVFTRRWSIERVASEPDELFVVQVRVFVRGRASDIGDRDG